MCFNLSRRSWSAAVLWLIATSTPAYSQTVILGKTGDEYYEFVSLGIEPNGTVVILGVDPSLSPTVFRLHGTTFELIELGVVPTGNQFEVTRISADARYAVGSFLSEEAERRSVLWDLAKPHEPKDLGTVSEHADPRARAVASTTEGPVVVGDSSLTGFVWAEATGIRPWVTNRPYVSRSDPVGITSDGTRVVGWEAHFVGTNLINLAIAGTVSNYNVLDTRDRPWAFAEAISPSGNWVCGLANLNGIIWDAKGHPRLLNFDANFHGLLTITDSGVAGGGSSLGGVIYEGRGRTLRLFDEWWSQTFSNTPLSAHVTRALLRSRASPQLCQALFKVPCGVRFQRLLLQGLRTDQGRILRRAFCLLEHP